MMMSEFIERTGFDPMLEEYENIEQDYYNFDGNKDEFCKQWLANGGIMNICRVRAKKIDQLNSKLLEIDRSHRQDDEKQMQYIADLEKRLDRELEWKPSESAGTNMSQERYEELLKHCTGNHGDPHVMSEEEARNLVAEECGFDPERIKIIETVHTYEVNKYRQLRKAATYTRLPLYDATDDNYIRFDVNCSACTWAYEMVDGELRQYTC